MQALHTRTAPRSRGRGRCSSTSSRGAMTSSSATRCWRATTSTGQTASKTWSRWAATRWRRPFARTPPTWRSSRRWALSPTGVVCLGPCATHRCPIDSACAIVHAWAVPWVLRRLHRTPHLSQDSPRPTQYTPRPPSVSAQTECMHAAPRRLPQHGRNPGGVPEEKRKSYSWTGACAPVRLKNFRSRSPF